MALFVDIKVIPSSGKSAWALDAQGMLKCYLKSEPEKGKANKELLTMLAKKLSIPQHDIVIVSGATSRKKRIKIERALEYSQLLVVLGLEVQESLFTKKSKGDSGDQH
jgi:uncharacterized protein (TIGR00251 family)